MKNNLLSIICLGLAMASCSKTAEQDCTQDAPQARVTLKLASSQSSTKASAIHTADESKVSSIQTFIFKDGILDAYANASSTEISAKEMNIVCTQGVRDIWVAVNAPDLSSVTSLAALKSAVSSLLDDNSSDSFVMVGSCASENVGASYSVSVSVSRLVSRIRLFELTRDMSNPALRTVDFEFVRAYIVNAAAKACYDIWTPSYPSSQQWLNSRLAAGGAMNVSSAFLCQTPASTASVTDGSTYGAAYSDASTAAAHTFYVYPNPHSEAGTGYDQTKLVVECRIDGRLYCYPIPIGAVSGNRSYDIRSLVITKLGNPSDGDDVVDDGEDDVISASAATFTVTVEDWTQVLTFGGVTDGVITI